MDVMDQIDLIADLVPDPLKQFHRIPDIFPGVKIDSLLRPRGRTGGEKSIALSPVSSALAADISDEELAYQAYTQQAKTTKDEKVAANLTRMAQDEKLHKAVFEKFLQDL